MRTRTKAQSFLIFIEEFQNKHKRVLGVTVAAAGTLGAGYLAHRHGLFPHHVSSGGTGHRVLGGALAATGGAAYLAYKHRSGIADKAADVVGGIARSAEKHGLTDVVPRLRVKKWNPSTLPANPHELKAYGTGVSGITREYIRAKTGV